MLRDDGTEVEMAENIDYGDTELRALLEGDRRYDVLRSLWAITDTRSRSSRTTSW